MNAKKQLTESPNWPETGQFNTMPDNSGRLERLQRGDKDGESLLGIVPIRLYRQRSGLGIQTTSSRVYTRVKRLGIAQTFSEAV